MIGRDPLTDESFNGFVARRAADERLDRVFELTQLAGAAYPRTGLHIPPRGDLDALASALDVDRSELESRTLDLSPDGRDRLYMGIPIRRQNLDHRVRRHSRGGLRISPHHRAAWQLRPFPFCRETWELLETECPRCGTEQRWYHAMGIERCDNCLWDLREGATRSVPQGQREALAAMFDLLHHRPEARDRALARLPSRVAELGPAGCVNLFGLLSSSLVDASVKADDRAVPWAAPAETVVRNLAEAWPLVVGYPDALVGRIEKHLRLGDAGPGGGARRGIVRFLKTPERDREGPEVRALVEEVRAALGVRLLDDVREGEFLDVKAVARTTGRGTAEVTALRRSGALGAVYVLGPRVVIPKYPVAGVAAIVADARERFPIESVAWRFGISEHGAEQLAATGMLDVLANPYFLAAYGSVQVRRRSVEAFGERLAGRLRSNPPSDWPRLLDVFKTIPGEKPWGLALRAISRGELRAGCADPSEWTARHLIVHPQDVACLDRFRFDREAYPGFHFAPSITKRDAEAALSISPQRGKDLWSDLLAPGGSRPRIAIADVRSLAAAMISIAELAARMALHPTLAFKMAEAAGLPRFQSVGYEREAAQKWLDKVGIFAAKPSVRPLGAGFAIAPSATSPLA